ncbi:MAG: bifunctional phosphopantothenoylcysteine decarboxylase/phosphopantothenate--cysteine ligase CoaBC [Acidobacteria bacterium]|nr:bifunctional phosphopantothenoylcysteine decarboxylase/phosphopantothenate--cysteine ligase CoaBC [Acidobacteriota bacterium]
MRVALGVGGGIAAYKAAELARALGERGAAVQVLMTSAAREFIQPLTFASLTGRKVITDLFTGQGAEEALSSSIEHIRVAQEHDVLVVAPATADLLARFAHGLANDFLTTTYLAFTGPVVLAPAMNTNMWTHPATVANLAVLRARGHHIVEPEEGLLACGMTGAGRLAEPRRIADAVTAALTPPARDLQEEVVLITAGPTQEPLDPVRFISNRSSGKMGYAIAAAALRRGARVILVTGPVSIPPPDGAQVVNVRTAAQMRDAVMEHLPESTVIIKSAAVADYFAADVPPQKTKKTQARWTIELDPTVDILAECGQKKGNRILIGFAAETTNLIPEARRKMTAKNCDMVVANLVADGKVFESDLNQVSLVLRSGEVIELKEAPKTEVAEEIVGRILALRRAALAHR